MLAAQSRISLENSCIAQSRARSRSRSSLPGPSPSITLNDMSEPQLLRFKPVEAIFLDDPTQNNPDWHSFTSNPLALALRLRNNQRSVWGDRDGGISEN